jgi:drug/metabolite transporter (DMT)-like permease
MARDQGADERRRRLTALIMLFACGGTYGLIFSLNRLAVDDGIPFLAYVFWQALFGGVILGVANLIAGTRPRLGGRYLRAYFAVSFLTLAFPYVLLTFIAPKLPAGVLGLGGTLSPGFTYLFALLLGLDRLAALRLAGIALGLAGVLLVVLPQASLPDSTMTGWVLLSLLVPVSYALGTITAARIAPKDGKPLAMACGHLLASALMVFPFMAGFGEWWFFDGPMTDGDYALIGAAFVNALFFALLFEIVRRAGPVFFATQNYVATLAGILWAVLIFGEAHSAYIWGALVLMLGGLYLVSRLPKPPAPATVHTS